VGGIALSIFAVFSAILLAIILFWVSYHSRILFVGIRDKRKRTYENLTQMPKFSIIVPAKDESNVIERCLTSLTHLNYPKDKLEIIVVIGNSKDDTPKICQDFQAKNPDLITVIHEKSSKGKPAALNLALPYATGDIVGVFDADSVPEDKVLQKISSYFQKPHTSAVQGSTSSLNENQNMLTKVAALEDRGWFQGLMGGREKLKLFVPFTGSCQFIRRSILQEAHGWDESALAEDVELSLKLAEKGHFVTFAPDVCSGQETPSTLHSLINQRTRWYRGYMEAAFKYGTLLHHRNRRTMDAELSLAGPFVMIVCLVSYINWGLSLAFSMDTTIFPFSALLVVALTSVTLISIGVSVAFSVKPVKAKNIVWIPFIYVYWFIQMLIASWAATKIIFRRSRVWGKTDKKGFVTPNTFHSEGAKLRVCFISSYPPNRARLSEYAQSLVNELANRPAIEKIYILADKTTKPIPASEFPENPKVKVLRIWKPDSYLSILRMLLAIITLRPNIVHFNVHFQSFGKSRLANFTGLSLIFLSRLLGFRVLAEVHNLGEKVDLAKVRLKPTFINKLGILVATKLILSAPRVVVTVKSYVKYLNDHYGHMGVEYIPHGTLVGNSQPIDPEEKIILMFGHMGPYKGLPVMMQAFQELRAEKYNVRLIVAGTSHPNFPEFLDEFKNRHLPYVEFLGYVPDENIARVFRMSDVVVIPYFTTTGTSGVFHLACGYGKPIVASNLPEIRELVEEGASAILVSPGDVQALKKAIVRVLSEEETAAKMSRCNLAFAQSESWGIIAEKYEEAYLELFAR
jgi:cellulose synthase/poly-beta-1,6-N-acetylglucosamine synthase-like glycosyltransferase